MNTEEIRCIVKNSKKSERFCSEAELKHLVQSCIKTIKQCTSNQSTKTENDRWLSDNFQFILTVQKSLCLKNKKITESLMELLGKVIRDKSFEGTKEDVFRVIEEIEKIKNFKVSELNSLREAFIISLFEQLRAAILSKEESVPHLICTLHGLNRVDFGKITNQFSPIERILKRDFAHVYANMTSATRSQYRAAVEKDAKRKRISPEKYAEDLIKKSTKEGKHVGFYLKRKRYGALYFPLIFTFSLVLSFCFGILFDSFVLSILFLPIFYFPSKTIFDKIFSWALRGDVLPEMKCSTVEKNVKTCVVITTLITSEKDVVQAISKIKRYAANNKKDNDFLYFGLLCDLPQSATAKRFEDEEIIRYLESKIDEINEESNCFFAMIRKRVYHQSEEAFVGWERKRGAIEQFIDYLDHGKLPDTNSVFGTKEIFGSKYLITLDADTELGIDQAKKLIGKMEHPLNRPVVAKLANGRKFVISGHGILQPNVKVSLLNSIETPFAKIFSNGGGKIPYAGASFDSMQVLFGEGNFCGKGIIDVKAYQEVMKGAIPQQKILSHDMPEGAFLRCGLVTDEYFLDSDPQTAISCDKRLHRWIRGDVQNLILLKHLRGFRKLFALENLLRYLLPLWQFLILAVSVFISPRFSAICVLSILTIEFFPFFENLLSLLLLGNFQIFGRRFRTKIRNQLLNTFYVSALSVMGIAHKAYYYTDAFLRALYRMLISKQKLLEWQTFSPFTKDKKDPLLFYLPSLIPGIGLLFVSNRVSLLLLSLSFVFYPFVMLALSEKYIVTDRLTECEKKKLYNYAVKEFSFFKNTVGESSSFLPPDNVQFEPIEKIANRTSPTNIGLYLTSLVSAVDLDIISQKECAEKIGKAFDSIEKMEHFQGQLFNWYDLSTLKVIGERFISTVDSGNFIASLIVVSQALKKWSEEGMQVSDLINRVDREIDQANFRILFDGAENLFFVGIYPDTNEKTASHYDLYMSEARITSFLSIALGQVSPSHWHAAQRPVLAFLGRVGIGSWTGTCFEYFMPSLFLPVIENSLDDESLDFAYYCQKKHGIACENARVFGISESGYSKTDPEGNLQYKAFGIPYLALQEKNFDSKVISPYSSFLMLQKGGKSILENLEALEVLGANGPMGFYEAIEFNSNFINDFKHVFSYMTHHKAMSFLSIANALNDGKNVKRFMNFRDFSHKTELLGERFPLEGKIHRKKRMIETESAKEISGRSSPVSLKKNAERGFSLSDGKTTLISYDDGTNRVLYNGVDTFLGGGIRCRVLDDHGRILFDFHQGEGGKYHFSPVGVQQILKDKKRSAVLMLAPIVSKDALFCRLEINGISEACTAEIAFDLLLMKQKDYHAHPAFHNLSLEGNFDGKTLTLRRRGIDSHTEIFIDSDKKFKTKFYGTDPVETVEWRALYKPKVKMIFHLDSAKRSVIPVTFAFSKKESNLSENSFDGSFHLLKEIREEAEHKLNRIDSICKTSKTSKQLLEKLLLISRKNRSFFWSDMESSKKSDLWKYGVSGDFPIVALHLENTENVEIEAIGQFISAFKKMMICGINDFDLLILHNKTDGYFNTFREKLSEITAFYGCEFLIGKHPGIHFIPIKNEDISFWKSASAYFVSSDQDNILKPVQAEPLRPEENALNTNPDSGFAGAFLKKGYKIDKSKFNPPVPFSHVIADSKTGFVCNQNSLGFTWYRNAGLNRITKWNNFGGANQGEKIFLSSRGKTFDLLSLCKTAKYLDSCVIYEGEVFDRTYRIMARLVPRCGVKAISVSFYPSAPENADLVYSMTPCLGAKADRNVLVHSRYDFILLNPSLKEEYSNGAFVCSDRGEIKVSSSAERLCFAIRAGKENEFFIGGYESEDHLSFLKKELKAFKFEEPIDEERENNELEPCSSELKFWLEYQAKASRFLGRTGLYQSSGAYGFRDQLQDSLIFMKNDSERTKIHLLRCASHQFEEGDVLHWWHPIRNQEKWDPGVRTRCSDDYLWLLYVTDEYIKETRDVSILSLDVPFLIGEPLKYGEDERYSVYKLGKKELFLKHLERAVQLFLSRGLGEHKLPFIGSGDWNDGMNRIDGESVWLGLFGAICLRRIKKFVNPNLQNDIDLFLAELHKGIAGAFNGVWFVRAFCKDGKVFGNDISTESECSIDLITLAFSAFYYKEFHGANIQIKETDIRSSLKAAYEVLVDEERRIIKLFTKPFVNSEPTPGYIQRYCAGFRENGGQYTHAAVWFAQALLEMGELCDDKDLMKKAEIVSDLLDPTKNNALSFFKRYKREPYVLCGDVYDAKGFRGHGGWSWYTGAASWYARLLEKLKKKNGHP